MPMRSRATSSVRAIRVSQMARPNMPRSRAIAGLPHCSYAWTMTSVSVEV